MDYLAFDLGAGSGKLFRGRFDGETLGLTTIHRFQNGPVPLGDGLYWDFLYIWNNLRTGIQKAARQGPLRSVGVDSYCNDFSFIDGTGDLLSPMRSYRDPRTIRCAEAIYRTMSPRELYWETGNQIAPFNTLMQLAAMRAEKKDAVLETARRLLFLPDLLAFYMTGEELAERSLSSVSQMFRFDTGTWSERILEAYRIPKRLFGALTDPGTVSGRTAPRFCRELAIDPMDFVSVCEHDTASAFLARPSGGDGAILSSGTWSLVGCESAGPVINDYGFQYNIANEGSFPGHHRLLCNVMGSWLLQELRADYAREGRDYSFAQLEALARESKVAGALIDTDDPQFFSPGEMRLKLRALCRSSDGVKPESPGEFARCVYDSLALKYRWAVERLETLTGRSFPVVHVIGGGSRDALSCQLCADVCGRPVLAGPEEASALGNLLAQLLAYGEIGDIAQGRELISNSFPPTRYEPKDTARWDEIYGKYRATFDPAGAD